MFGYFRPNKAHLIGEQTNLFNAYYCRLCYCLRIGGGQKARAFTTFDITLYSMILNLFLKHSSPPVVKCEKIKKGNLSLYQDDIIGQRLASLSFIAFGEKIRDDEIDGNTFRAKILKFIYGKSVKVAQEKEPEMTKIAYEGTELINKLQKENAELHTVLEAYGKMTTASFSLLAPLPAEYSDLISYLAQWTFFVDMLCDYDDDVKNHAPNSLYKEDTKTIAEYFDKYWYELYQENKKLADKIYELLLKIRDDSIEWITLYKIVINALDNVVGEILAGQDVKFHYFKELFKNHKINQSRKKNNKKRVENVCEELK